MKEFTWVVKAVSKECKVSEEEAIKIIAKSLRENQKPLTAIYNDACYVYENQ